MLKIINSAFLVLALMATSVCYGQDEITLEFSQSMSTEDEDLEAMIDMMGTTTTKLYMKGEMVRTEITNDMLGSTIAIYDGEKGKGITLMDVQGSKVYDLIDDSTSVDEPVDSMKYVVVKQKKKQKFLGYKCLHYVITDTTGTVISLYVAPKLNAENESQYSADIKGQALYSKSEIIANGSQVVVIMEATKVTLGALDNKLFDISIPEGYTLSTL